MVSHSGFVIYSGIARRKIQEAYLLHFGPKESLLPFRSFLSFYASAGTRGNNYKLVNHSFHYDLRKHFFSAHIVNIWNSLANSVVDARTVNAFKKRLGKFLWHQAVK